MKTLTIIGLTLSVVFLTLKLAGVIAWEWVWVLCPLWILGIIYGLIVLLVLVVVIFAVIVGHLM